MGYFITCKPLYFRRIFTAADVIDHLSDDGDGGTDDIPSGSDDDRLDSDAYEKDPDDDMDPGYVASGTVTSFHYIVCVMLADEMPGYCYRCSHMLCRKGNSTEYNKACDSN
jgi:hypothetical protein